MCDTLVSLTNDGVLFAKNSDRDPNEAQYLEWSAAAEHPRGTEVACTWITIAQERHTNAVLLSRPWWMWGAEIGANEHGVIIGNEAVFTRGSGVRGRAGAVLGRSRESEPGLLGMDLLRLALERSSTATDAVTCMVELLERHGQGGSCSFEHPRFTYDNSFIVADRSGAIVLETAGRSHATEVVTGRARSISNGLTIPGFAEANEDPIRSRVADCTTRAERTRASAERAEGVADMMAALRDHGPSGHPRYSPINGALGAPCAHPGGLLTSTQSTASWVGDLRGRFQHWATGTSAPCTSLFKPVNVDEAVDLGPAPGNAYDPRTLWWRHERLHRLVMRNPGALLNRYRAERDATESAWIVDPPPSAHAFAHGEDLERRWLESVSEAVAAKAAPAVRPGRVGRQWERWNRESAFST